MDAYAPSLAPLRPSLWRWLMAPNTANGNGGNGSSTTGLFSGPEPWWNKSLNVILRNATVAVMLYLVWWMTHDFSDKMNVQVQLMTAHIASQQRLADAIEQSSAHDRTYQKVMVQLAAETCKQQANTSAAARVCDALATNWMISQ